MKTDPYLLCPDQTVTLHGIRFPLEYLYRGMLVIGQPGSGKTRCILMPLIKSILATTGNAPERKASFIVADPKNELAPFMAEVLAAVGRADDLIVLKPGAAWYNPLGSPFLVNENEMIEKIVSFAENTHRQSFSPPRDHAYWENAQRNLLGAIITATRTLHGPRLSFDLLNQTFREVDRFKTAQDAAGWMSEKNFPPAAINGIRDFLKLPHDTTRPSVASCVSNCLYFWQREPLAQLITPSELIPSVDPLDIVHQGKVLVIGCSGPAFGVSITPLLLALKEHFFAALLSRDQIEVAEEGGWKLINQDRPVFFVADEFQSYMSASHQTGELTALDRLRGFKTGYIAATQNLASLHSVLGDSTHAIRLISLFSNQAFLANICPVTAAQASHILGTKKVREGEVRAQMAPPLLLRTGKRFRSKSRDGLGFTRTEPRVNAGTLAAMSTGEFWLRQASGKVRHGKV
jgi:type IV secretory pathway TraG/TraD family ATPase VirD4